MRTMLTKRQYEGQSSKDEIVQCSVNVECLVGEEKTVLSESAGEEKREEGEGVRRRAMKL